MRWRKLGLVYGPTGGLSWAKSHAMIPTPVRLSEDVVRVFITCCDEHGIGRPSYVDVSAHDPLNVLKVSQEPILDIGPPGTFDENGILTCSIVRLSEKTFYMYYAGFELGTKIRYRLLTGLAISDDGGETFRRAGDVPVLERSARELFFRGGPFCRRRDGGFQMWYVAGSSWTDLDGKPMPVYDIRYLESPDGISWPAEGKLVLPVTEADEHGFGRPYVISRTGGGYRLFYSVRRRSLGAYRLGYAESADGARWNRMDESLNLDVSPVGFDSEAIMYAAPIEIDDRLFVFYNGNAFGKDGFAAAVLEDE